MAKVGGDTQAAIAGQAAHVRDEAVTDEAVSAVHAQPLPIVSVPQVDAVSFLSDGRSCEGATHRFLTRYDFFLFLPRDFLELACGAGG